MIHCMSAWECDGWTAGTGQQCDPREKAIEKASDTGEGACAGDHMGNRISCMSLAVQHQVAGSAHNNIIKVLHTDTSSISELAEPLTAAELMMEYPCQFVSCHSSVVSHGHRICPVPADEELRPGELYILLPMYKLNSRFSTEELAFFSALVLGGLGQKPLNGKHSSKAASQSKVAPLPRLITAVSAATDGVSPENSVGLAHPLRSLSPDAKAAPPLCFTHPGVICRSKAWIPKLETISEASMSKAF